MNENPEQPIGKWEYMKAAAKAGALQAVKGDDIEAYMQERQHFFTEVDTQATAWKQELTEQGHDPETVSIKLNQALDAHYGEQLDALNQKGMELSELSMKEKAALIAGPIIMAGGIAATVVAANRVRHMDGADGSLIKGMGQLAQTAIQKVVGSKDAAAEISM